MGGVRGPAILLTAPINKLRNAVLKRDLWLVIQFRACFFNISKQLENGGEVAHSDVIKAQIQYQDRQRDLREAQLAMDKARLTLAVLLFPNFNENFTVVDDLDLAPPLQSFEEFAKLAQTRNPELRVATASLQAAGHEVTAATAAPKATASPYDPSKEPSPC